MCKLVRLYLYSYYAHIRFTCFKCTVVPVSLLAVRVSAILYVAIFSGPGRFTITDVFIGLDRNLINVTYMEVSHVTIYNYRLCMTL